jgi:hypothetical protein
MRVVGPLYRCGYVIGFTAIEVKPPELTPDAELRRAMRKQLELTTLEDFLIVSELMSNVTNLAFGLSWKPDRFGASRSSFEWGLDALLSGVGARTQSSGSR